MTDTTNNNFLIPFEHKCAKQGEHIRDKTS
jgi:hypothetical protein